MQHPRETTYFFLINLLALILSCKDSRYLIKDFNPLKDNLSGVQKAKL